MVILAFAGNWDATALGTLALAIVTGVSLAFAWGSLKQSQHQLEQTQRAIELSRREVEEAHRPVLMPMADSRRIEVADPHIGGAPPARPMHLGKGDLLVPIENIGMGPALRVEVSVQILNPDGGPTAFGTGAMKPAVVAGIKTSVSVSPIVKIHGLADVPGFWLTLTYEDLAGKKWVTKARYIATELRYTDETVNTQETQ